eukprot:1951972-Rhodomonas_salina.2
MLAVRRFLAEHPAVCGAQQLPDAQQGKRRWRDAEYFGDVNARRYAKERAEGYLSWFHEVPKCIALAKENQAHAYMDGSVSNFGDLAVPKRIKDLYPPSLHGKLRFLMTLREPMERDREGARGRNGKKLGDARYQERTEARMGRGSAEEWEDSFYEEILQAFLKEFRREQGSGIQGFRVQQLTCRMREGSRVQGAGGRGKQSSN